jgi:putative flavoprotein involved in K+ transport
MNGSILDVVVVGAGHAGLSVSYYLKQLELEHMVFERGRVGESWRSQRWNSFTLNTLNRLNALPGSSRKIKEPERFPLATEFLTSLEHYVSSFQLPVSENARVLSIEKPAGSPFFIITVAHENEPTRKYNSWQVVVASGCSNEKKMPSYSDLIPSDIKQFHSSEYKNPVQLPDGAILVVGSAQSGCQITEELLDAGKTVYLSTSQVPRIPRRYRGKDIMDWLMECHYYDVKRGDVKDPEMLRMKEPLLSGIGEHGHTLSLQYLSGKGAILLGRMKDIKNDEVFFGDNVLQHINYANDFSDGVKAMIDAFIIKSKQQMPELEMDVADHALESRDFPAPIPSFRLSQCNIKTIVWATGMKGNPDFVKFPILDSDGQPKHQYGVTEVEGLYFIGYPWLHSRKSNLIYGIKDDAGFICNKIYSSLR